MIQFLCINEFSGITQSQTLNQLVDSLVEIKLFITFFILAS
jgi:hypothetical protein